MMCKINKFAYIFFGSLSAGAAVFCAMNGMAFETGFNVFAALLNFVGLFVKLAEQLKQDA